MEPMTYGLVALALALIVLTLVAARRRRDADLAPVRLGPSWEPPDGAPTTTGPDIDDPRVEVLAARTALPPATVREVLGAWDEHLSVLGFLSLPPSHRYRVYDPYDPPVASRDAANRPVADPRRVARDVERRTAMSELDARTVLEALLAAGDPGEGSAAEAATPSDRATRSDEAPLDQRS